MFLLVPTGVDNPLSRLPLVNWGLIAANVAVFYLVGIDPEVWQAYGCVPADLRPHQLVTACFLHVGFLHLLGNMIFLWTFGNNANDKLGHLGYLGAYLGCGVLASLGHAAAEAGSAVPAIGASGAVFGVTGMYLAFFPVNDVRMLYVIWLRPGTFRCSAFWMIGFWVAWNLLWAVTGLSGNVAVMAHLAGFGAGFLGGLFLLAAGIVARDEDDFLSWLSGRRQAKRVARFAGPRPGREFGLRPSAAFLEARAEGARSGFSERELRRLIGRLLAAGDLWEAEALYRRLTARHPGRALREQAQADLANRLYRAGLHEAAAEAYERFARVYDKHRQAPETLYSAGMICARHLRRFAKARRLLTAALSGLADPAKASRARQALRVIERASNRPPAGVRRGAAATGRARRSLRPAR